MQHAPPSNDKQRTTFLEVLTRQATQDSTDGFEILTAELVNRAETLKQRFFETQDTTREILSRRRAATETKNRAIAELDRMNRDFWEVLKRRTRRVGHSETIMDQYRLSSENGPPRDPRANEVLVTARLIIEGEPKAVEAGYPPMSNPSTGELGDQLELAETAQQEATKAERDHLATQKRLDSLRQEVQTLLETILHYFRYRLEDSTPAQQRRTMRRYGYTFTNNRGEPEEEAIPAPIPEPEPELEQLTT